MGLKCLPLIDHCSLLFYPSPINFLIWNCRGALKPSFQNYIHDLTQKHDPAIFAIMETKLGGNRAKEVTDRLPSDGAIHTETIGLSSGLWLLWNADKVLVKELAKTEQEIHVEVKGSSIILKDIKDLPLVVFSHNGSYLHIQNFEFLIITYNVINYN
nr:uncharacterized protein LOC111992963 [Quercus suber]